MINDSYKVIWSYVCDFYYFLQIKTIICLFDKVLGKIVRFLIYIHKALNTAICQLEYSSWFIYSFYMYKKYYKYHVLMC